MAKLAIFLVAVFALLVTLAGTINNQQSQLLELSNQIEEISNSAANLIQNQRIGNNLERRYLSWQANEYVQNIQNVIYNMQLAIQSNERGPNQLQLQQILRRLSEIAYSIQQAISGEASQLRLQLRWNIQNVRIEAQRIAEIAKQLLNKSRNDENNLNIDIRWALDRLLRALLRLQVQSQLQSRSQEEIKNQIQSLAPALSTAIDRINTVNELSIQNLANRAWELARISGNIIKRLQIQLRHNNNGDSRNVLREIINRLSEIREALDQAGSINSVDQLQELKNQLKSNIGAIIGQIERLLQLVQPDNQENQQIQNLNDILKSLIIDAITSAENLQIQLRIAGGQNNQTN